MHIHILSCLAHTVQSRCHFLPETWGPANEDEHDDECKTTAPVAANCCPVHGMLAFVTHSLPNATEVSRAPAYVIAHVQHRCTPLPSKRDSHVHGRPHSLSPSHTRLTHLTSAPAPTPVPLSKAPSSLLSHPQLMISQGFLGLYRRSSLFRGS